MRLQEQVLPAGRSTLPQEQEGDGPPEGVQEGVRHSGLARQFPGPQSYRELLESYEEKAEGRQQHHLPPFPR